MLRKEKIGDSSGGMPSTWAISGGLFEKIIDAGRVSISPPLGVEPPAGENSEGGEGVSGDGVCHRGGVSTGEALFEDLRLSFPEALFLGPPNVDINERTKVDARARSVHIFREVLPVPVPDRLTT